MSNLPALPRSRRAPVFTITDDLLRALGIIGEKLNAGMNLEGAEMTILSAGLLPLVDEALNARAEQDALLRRLVEHARAEGPKGKIAQILYPPEFHPLSP